jgi:hypothetical protein
MIEALALGLHMASIHAPQRDQSNSNPGLYLRMDRYQLGGYRNSHHRPTFYAGYAVHVGSLDLMLGVASGYQRRCRQFEVQTPKKVVLMEECKGFSRGALTPLAAMSYAVPISIAGATPRIWFMPGFKSASSVAHLSLEWSIK